MSQPSGKPIYIPPYSGVRLIECREHFQLVPVPAMKVLHGYGKIRADRATSDFQNPSAEPLWDDLGPEDEVWAIVEWYQLKMARECQGTFRSCGRNARKMK